MEVINESLILNKSTWEEINSGGVMCGAAQRDEIKCSFQYGSS